MKKLIVPTIVILTLMAFYFLNLSNIAPNPIPIVTSDSQLKKPVPTSVGYSLSPSMEPDGLINKSTAELLAITVNCRKQMEPITTMAKQMGPGFDTLCRDRVEPYDDSVHRREFAQGHNVWISVYLSKNALDAFQNGKQQFPAGTVVIKEKLWKDGPDGFNLFEKKTARLPDRVVLYTGMLKREKGFNPECGDWEFFTVRGEGDVLTSRGKLVSCMNCHKDYAQSDYVVTTKEPPLELPW